MQVLSYLKIKNFLGTKNREVFFDQHNTPLFIVGENAQGKTTIMRAVFFALTGEDAFFGMNHLDSLINDQADFMQIELALTNKRKDYVITVEKKRGKGINISITENGNLITDGRLLKDTKRLLVQTFGNPTSMMNTYFIFGNGSSDFVEATPSKRLNIITKISDRFKEYDAIAESAKKMVGKRELDKNKVMGVLNFLKQSQEEQNSAKKQIEQEDKEEDIRVKMDGNIFPFEKTEAKREKQIDAIKEQISLKKQIAEKENIIQKAKDFDIETARTALQKDEEDRKQNEERKEEKRNIEKEIYTLSEKKSEMEKEIQKITSEKETAEKLIAEKQRRIEKVELVEKEVYSSVEEIDEVQHKIEKALSNIETKGKELGLLLKEKEVEIKQIEKEEKELVKQLQEATTLFKQNNHCPLCYNPLTEKGLGNYKEFLEEKQQALTEKKATLLTSQEELSKAKEKEATQWTEFNKKKQKVAQYREDFIKRKKNAELQEEIAELSKEVEEKKEALKTQEQKLTQEKQAIQALREKKDAIQLLPVLSDKEREEYTTSLQNAQNINYQIQELKALQKKLPASLKDITLQEIKDNLSLLTQIYNEEKAKDERKKTIAETLKNITKDIKKNKDLLEEINVDIAEYEKLSLFFGKNGVQKQQIKQLLRQIELETNSIVSRFFPNILVKFEYEAKGIDLTINRRVFDNHGGFVMKSDVIKNFSDAQQEVLTVLLKLSFSKVVQHLNDIPLNILFLNETFNTLSKDKEAELMNMLQFYNKDYHLVFITHNLDLVSQFDEQNVLRL